MPAPPSMTSEPLPPVMKSLLSSPSISSAPLPPSSPVIAPVLVNGRQNRVSRMTGRFALAATRKARLSRNVMLKPEPTMMLTTLSLLFFLR